MLLPGVATATPGNPFVGTFGQCRFDGGASGTIGPSTRNRTGSHGPTIMIDIRWDGLTSCS